jgi:two-component system chemotaxis response regulator CheV
MSKQKQEEMELHTKLAGKNRFEMLLFKLITKQRYGINVFKVKEVVHCLSLTKIPERHSAICGIATIREMTIPVIDLSLAVHGPVNTNIEKGFIIVTEYNSSIQGFLVSTVEKIVNLQWDQINPPPVGVTNIDGSYLSAVTNIDNEIIEILDVEKVLQEINPVKIQVEDNLIQQAHKVNKNKSIIIVDDSSVARNQISRVLKELGFNIILFKNGKEALNALQNWLTTNKEIFNKIGLIICDIEMPEMDGYTFTSKLRQHAEFKNLFIILHTSVSGTFNQALVDQVGADKFVSKFDPNKLAKIVLENIK